MSLLSVFSDMLLSHIAGDRLFHTAGTWNVKRRGPLYACTVVKGCL